MSRPESTNVAGALLLALVATATPVAQVPAGERQAINAYRRAELGATTPAERLRALGLLAGHDSKAVARALAASLIETDDAIRELDERRLEAGHQLVENLEGTADEKKRGTGRGQRHERTELRVELANLRLELDELRPLHAALVARIAALRSPDSLSWLDKNVLHSQRHGVAMKVTVARSIGAHGQGGARQLGRALGSARSADLVAALCVGLGAAGEAAQESVPLMIQQLEHGNRAVRELCAAALANTRDARAIAPIIDLLAREKGQATNRIASSLERLTGQQHGVQVFAWRAWYAEKRAALLAGRIPLGDGEPSKRTKQADQSYYMGLPQDGRSIVYVLDASASMVQEIDFQAPGVTTSMQGKATRFDACKSELIRALGELTPDKRFSIVAFHDVALRFSEVAVPATAENLTAAQTWVRDLRMDIMTNTHDAMQEALAMLARDPRDRPLGDEIDTIFLLTDGRPYVRRGSGPLGRPDQIGKILAAIDSWDPLGRVTIHCIGIGRGLTKRFLRQIARRGGGEARFY